MKNLTLRFWLAAFALVGLAGWAQAQSVTLCHNGNTISVSPNAVNAHLAHGDVLGECCINPALIDPNRFCITLYDPVCGCDGVTYSNGCFASAAGVMSYTPGACASQCKGEPTGMFCPTYVDPVCGCDGVTYSNGCFASAAGVRSYTPGACGGGFKRPEVGSTAAIVPNPTSGIATISWTPAAHASTTVLVTDMLGKVVRSSQPIDALQGALMSYQVDAADLEAGIYHVVIRTDRTVETHKLVVQH